VLFCSPVFLGVIPLGFVGFVLGWFLFGFGFGSGWGWIRLLKVGEVFLGCDSSVLVWGVGFAVD
jgi:hypothetical protein